MALTRLSPGVYRNTKGQLTNVQGKALPRGMMSSPPRAAAPATRKPATMAGPMPQANVPQPTTRAPQAMNPAAYAPQATSGLIQTAQGFGQAPTPPSETQPAQTPGMNFNPWQKGPMSGVIETAQRPPGMQLMGGGQTLKPAVLGPRPMNPNPYAQGGASGVVQTAQTPPRSPWGSLFDPRSQMSPEQQQKMQGLFTSINARRQPPTIQNNGTNSPQDIRGEMIE